MSLRQTLLASLVLGVIGTPTQNIGLVAREEKGDTEGITACLGDQAQSGIINSVDVIKCWEKHEKRSTDQSLKIRSANVATLQSRNGPADTPPKATDLTYLDDWSNTKGEDKIPKPYMRTDHFDDKVSPEVCKELTKVGLDNKNDTSAIYAEFVGWQKNGLSVKHKGTINTWVSLTPLDEEALKKYNVTEVCQNALHKSAQVFNELQWGAFNSHTDYSMFRNHYLQVQETAPIGILPPRADGVLEDRDQPQGTKKSNTIAVINIEFNNAKNDKLELFSGNGIPA
jgi:hypothetical protein